MTDREKSTSEALAEARALKYRAKMAKRVYSERSRDLYGEPDSDKRGPNGHRRWTIRRAGDNNSNQLRTSTDRIIARVVTDSKKVVVAVIEALLPFHEAGTL